MDLISTLFRSVLRVALPDGEVGCQKAEHHRVTATALAKSSINKCFTL